MSQTIDPQQNMILPPELAVGWLELEIIETPLERMPLRTWTVAHALSRTSNSDAVGNLSDFYLEPQEESGFVAFSKDYPGAVGQGETEEEALKDLQEAISLLKEVLDEEETLR